MTDTEKGKKLREIRNRLDWTQRRMADALKLDPTYLSQLENGSRTVDAYYLDKAGDIEKSNSVKAELKEALEKSKSVDLRFVELSVLEDLFRSYGRHLKDAVEPERTKLMDSLNAVHEELKWREREAKRAEDLGPQPVPALEGKGLTDDVRETALGSRDIAGHIARQPADPKYPPSHKAASPSGSKSPPGAGAPAHSKGGSGGQSKARNE